MDFINQNNVYEFIRKTDEELKAIQLVWLETYHKLLVVYNSETVKIGCSKKVILDELKANNIVLKNKNGTYKPYIKSLLKLFKNPICPINPITKLQYRANSSLAIKSNHYVKSYVTIERDIVADNLVEFVQKIKAELSRLDDRKKVLDQKIVSSVLYCKTNNIDMVGLNSDEIYCLANTHAKDLYCSENIHDGDTVDISCCDDCNEWTIGERRCSCGNRRMYMNIEGNFLEGFRHYPEAD